MSAIAPRLDRDFARLIAPLSDDELEQLEANIVRDGCRDPIVTWNGLILDGYNRFDICTRRDKRYKTVAIALPDREAARIWIRWNQLGRRNLTDSQRAGMTVDLLEELAQQSKRTRATTAVHAREVKAGRKAISEATSTPKIKAPPSRAREKVAKRASVTQHKIRQAATVKKRSPELHEKVKAGEITLAEAMRQTKPAARAERLEAAVWPDGKYGVILADPPWRPDPGLLDKTRRIENQYPTQTLEELIAHRPQIDRIALADCVLLLWTTTQKIAEAIALIGAWQFTVKSGAVWIKPSVGMGYWFRGRHELLILATRGEPMTPLEADRPDSVITAPRADHSQKPDLVYELIDRMFPHIPKVEIFARATRAGWHHATNETTLRSA
jgi:N6-adenosine-specific RNA methylase IME4